MFPTIQILHPHHKRFLSGYPWVYANEIAPSHITKSLEPGQLVTLQYQGQALANGYYNRHSLIAFRRLANTEQNIDEQFFQERLQCALEIREAFFKQPFYRLIHAEADGLPGVIIDRFDSVFVVQINTQGIEKLEDILCKALMSRFNPTSILLKKDSSIRKLESMEIRDPIFIGKPASHLLILENEIKFTIPLNDSQKTGWFFDHRENRAMIAKLAHGKRVIDYFCYCGGFSIQAALGGAKHVIGIDRSEAAIENARRTAEKHDISQHCEFKVSEAFEDMDERINDQQSFDIVILDPPAFVKSKKDFAAGLKGYEKLIAKGLKLVAKNGLLLIASCSYHVKENDLKACLANALSKDKRTARILRTLSAGPDHPTHPLLEESAYLKGFLVAVD